MKEQTEEKNTEIGEVISNTEQFIEKNQKTLIIVAAAIVVVVLGFFGLRKFYFQPRQERAANEMFAAEQLFGQDQYELALNGNEKFAGFNDIIKQYGCTKAGKLARLYAGECNLYLGNYDEAMKNLKSYKGKDTFTKAQALTLMGDCEFEKDNIDAAIKYYEKSVKAADNLVTTPNALFKEGWAYIAKGNSDKALECFENIKTNYAGSTEWNDIDKYIGLAKGL